MTRLCACGHTRHAHGHYTRGGDTRCALCDCQRYRPRWPWRRPAAVRDTPAQTATFTQCGAQDRMWMCIEAPGHLGDHRVYVDGQEVHRWAAKLPAPAASPRPVPGRNPVPGQHFPPEVQPLSPPGGHAPAPVPAREPARPAQAPAPGHDYGPLDCVTKHWACGCRHYFDAGMRLVAVMPCGPDEPDLLDLEYRDLFTREGP